MLFWILFNLAVIILLILDLKVFHRKSHVIGIKESLIGSAFWILLALLFCAGVYYVQGPDQAMRFLAGYLIEKSLSVDNLFVFLVVFSFFKVDAKLQHRVLFWGILGALVMRALFIWAGVSLIHNFHWIIYIFGAFLVFTGYKLVKGEDKKVDPEKNVVLKAMRKIVPVTQDYVQDKFFVKRAGKLWATPLFAVLVVIETTDVIFAVDSIPAILSVSTDPFIVYTSNVLAILGLRALYFALAALMRMFHYLNYGLGLILVFVGIKMLITDIYHLPIAAALGVICGILSLSVILSILFPKKHHHS